MDGALNDDDDDDEYHERPRRRAQRGRPRGTDNE